MPFDNAVFIKPNTEFNPCFSFKDIAPMFRKKFFLNHTANAKLYVCGLGYGYYYINGQKVTDDVFTAPVSNYLKTLWYNTYDVSHLLKKGENVIAVICGNGWYNESMEKSWLYNKAKWRDLPKVIVRLEVGGKTALVTDDTWLCSTDGPVYFNQLRLGEYFDANKYDENWTAPGFDDSKWETASKDYTPPVGTFRECKCEPIREHEIYEPIDIWQSGENRYIYDIGQNISGYIRLQGAGNKDDRLTIRYSECINEKRELEYYGMDTYFCNEGFQTDKFICSGKMITWSPKFTYHGFRYIEIDGIKNPDDFKVSAVFVHQAVERRTHFQCSDEFLNRMYHCGIMSSFSNMFYMITDCPTREKLGWANDAQSSAEQLLINFKTEALFEKWMQDIKDSMLSDGSLPGIIPTSGWGYHWGNGPVSDGILFEIPYRVYLHTGNGKLLIDALDYFKKYLRYLENKKTPNGTVEFGLDDWAAPGDIHVVETGFINAVLMYSFYKTTHMAAKLAGDSDAQYYLDEANKLRNFIADRYISSDGRCTINEQCSVAMLIYYDIYDDLSPLKAQLAALVEANDFHLKCGMVGLRRLLLALNKCDLAQYAYKLLTAEGYPGFRVWLDGGATTLWEKWDVNQMSDSKNHHMYSDFMSWMVKTLAGISINEAKCGETEFLLAPVFLDGIDFVDFKYHTVCGDISISWRKTDGKIILDVEKDSAVKLIYKGKSLKNNTNRIII